jgi:hypothetical protein
MKKQFILNALFVALILSSGCLNARDTIEWKGFTPYNFTFEQRDARLVVPDHPVSHPAGQACPGKKF